MNARVSRRRALLGAGAFALQACLPDGQFKKRHTVVPEPLDDGWEVATPGDVGLDPGALEAIHEELLRQDRQRGALGMLVIKDGLLVWETYLRDVRDRDRHQHVQAITQSVTSLALGLAYDRGHFESLMLTRRDLIPEELTGKASNKGDISLEQLLTMRSGIDFGDDFSVEMWVDKPPHPLHYMLEKRLFAAPGSRFRYRDVDPQILGYLLQNEVGTREEDFTREWLFRPLGIHNYLWERGPDGVSMAPHGLHLMPRDIAKLGQLVLDQGMFGNTRVLSSDWIAQATRTRVDPGAQGTGRPRLGYGYLWWTAPALGVINAWGHGGQQIVVAPRARLVLVKIALPDADHLEGSSLESFLDLVTPLLDG